MIKHLSYSSVSLYGLCARAFKFRYIDKIKTPVAAALPFGSAFHNAIEQFIVDLQQPTEMKMTVEDYFVDAWIEQQGREQGIDFGDKSPEELAELGKRMLGARLDVTGGGPNRKMKNASAFLDMIVPQVVDGKPTIEKKITLSVPGVDVPIIGYIDLITSDGVPCDFKTSARSWYAKKAHEEMQPNFYLAALTQSGQPSPDLKFRYYIFTKTKTPKAQIIETKRTPAQLFWTMEMIREVWDGIQAGVFPPTGPGSWKCSEKYCEFWGLCRGK